VVGSSDPTERMVVHRASDLGFFVGRLWLPSPGTLGGILVPRTFQVTPASLEALGSAVGRVRDQLSLTGDLGQDVGAALGSDVVAGALHHFVTGWHDGRAQICADVGQLSDLLNQASTVYAATDGDLAAAMS
jgi:hypothetical protein